METHSYTTKLQLIFSSKLLLYSILQFLQPPDISQLTKTIPNTNQFRNHLLSLLQNFLFIQQFLCLNNRDLYFDIYQQPRFKIIEKSIIAQQVENNPIYRQLLQATNHLKQLLPSNHHALQTLQIIANDPPIPMAKLIRENVGLGCSSIFQNFLLANHEQLQIDRQHQWLLDYHEKRLNIYIQNLTANLQSQYNPPNKSFENQNLTHKNQAQSILYKINILCFNPHQITYSNMNQYSIQQNELHNFIVSLFALTDIVVTSSMQYINGIQEPYHKFVQFCLRYQMFRNFVIAVQVLFSLFSGICAIIQEQFSPLLDMYLQICDQSLVSSQNRSLSFWKSAFQKWTSHMSIFHQTCIETLICQNTKLRHQNLLSILQQICNAPDEDKKNMNNFKDLNIDQILPLQMPIIQQVYELVSQEFPFCNNSFNNYMMDISIDENTVFWCGHQNQKVGPFYENFQNQILTANQIYYDKIIKLCGKDFYRKIIQEDLQFIGSDEMYKQKTIIKFICQTNQTLNTLGLPRIQIPIENKYKQLQQQIQRSNSKLGIPMFTQQIDSNFYQVQSQNHKNQTILMKPSPNNGTLDTNDTYKLQPEQDSYVEQEKNYPFAQEDEESFMQDQSKQMSENSDLEPFQPPSSSAFPQWVL